jgi:hypothetical protein
MTTIVGVGFCQNRVMGFRAVAWGAITGSVLAPVGCSSGGLRAPTTQTVTVERTVTATADSR